ncbi:MAG: hypothetical protein NC489_28580 [Ruminococcus flavefaciens]|nr:hypothetical protein [Ruminococcus flavefaciens]
MDWGVILKMYNTISYYPDGIDPMIFFQDNDLDKVNIINNYNQLIALGEYTKANDYIKSYEDIYGYFAEYFNAIEQRIYNTQKYLLIKKSIKKQFVVFDSSEEEVQPDIEEGMFWF